jgi:hypothetical protein
MSKFSYFYTMQYDNRGSRSVFSKSVYNLHTSQNTDLDSLIPRVIQVLTHPTAILTGGVVTELSVQMHYCTMSIRIHRCT